MSREFLIHQALHGYRSGHQLLASSVDLSISERERMDVMSDGAGINDENCPQGYLTGYALPENGKYVLAKTWYADDMDRPGCVWTHSLIFEIADISCMRFASEILRLFSRPQKGQFDGYAVPVRLCEMPTEMDLDKLQYVLYTIYASNRPRYVEITDNGYEESVLFAISHMPQKLLLQFSFCSESLVNRYIDGKIFSYQLVKRELLYRVYSEEEGRLFSQKSDTPASPAWAREYGRLLLQGEVDKIDMFCNVLNRYLLTFQSFNQLLRLYFITDKISGQYSLLDYYEILGKLAEEMTESLQECVWRVLLDSGYFDSLFLDYFLELVDIAKKYKIRIKKADKQKIVSKILNKQVKKVPEFLERYIHGALRKQDKDIPEMLIKQAEPKHLQQITNMEHDIVVVAVKMNNNLILSESIFKMSKDYQCDMINELNPSLSLDEWEKILTFILSVSEEDISEAVSDKLGDRLVPLLLELFQKELPRRNKSSYIWDKYLLENQEILVQNLSKFSQEDVRKRLLLKIDTYNEKVREAIAVEGWMELFQMCNAENEEEKKRIAIKMLPLILNHNQKIPMEMAAYVFGILHQALAESQITYEQWSEFQDQIPEVDMCFAWDKCLRLRKAFEKRGYDIELLFKEYEDRL